MWCKFGHVTLQDNNLADDACGEKGAWDDGCAAADDTNDACHVFDEERLGGVVDPHDYHLGGGGLND